MGIYRRGKTWWARKGADGRELRESLKTEDRRIAVRRFKEWSDQLDAIAFGERPRRTFAAAVEKFVSEHLSTLKPASAKRYAVSLKWLGDHFAGGFLDQITRERLSEFETARRVAGASNPTIRRDLACLSSLLTSCEDWDYVAEGGNIIPAYMRRRAKRGLKEAAPRTRYLTEAEEAKLLEATSPSAKRKKSRNTPPVGFAIALAIDTGLRREELFSLTWAQIDLRRNIITTTTRTKNGKARSVPLPHRSAQILAQLKPTKSAGVTSLYVLRHETGERLVTMDTGLKAAARRAKLKDLRWHDLRRTAGCRWLQRDGRSMEEVSTLLGHSSVAVTETRYAFLDGEAVAESVAQKSHMDERTENEKKAASNT